MLTASANSSRRSREISAVVDSVRTLEGGGIEVRRALPGPQISDVDPFLLLDHWGPVEWKPGEAIGVPEHPHRGFETVTYILAGRNQHKDSKGHTGILGPGDVQWMTAGAGVVHSEMPELEFKRIGGLSHGFQIWVNLPARDKMMEPRYQEVPKNQIPTAQSEDGLVDVRVIAGQALGASAVIETRTPIMLLHCRLQPGGHTVQPVPADHNGFVYVFSGEVELGDEQRRVGEGRLAVLGEGDDLKLGGVRQDGGDTDLLLLSGVPLREPVVRYGPFVMNTRQEIQQAIMDYERGQMGQIAH